MAKLVSKTYGEALFEIAMEQNRLRELMEEIQVIQKIIDENPEFQKLMKHPGIPKQEKLQMIHTIFKDRVSDELTCFMEVVVSKDRYSQLDSIFRYFVDKVKEVERIGTAYVVTAAPLTDAQKENVKSRLLQTTKYLTIEINYSVDPSLLGGMIIRIKDRVIDSSIKSKIDNMTKQLLKIQLG